MCQAIQEMMEDVRVDSWKDDRDSGAQETSRKFAVNLSQMGFTPEMIAKVADTSPEIVLGWLSGK